MKNIKKRDFVRAQHQKAIQDIIKECEEDDQMILSSEISDYICAEMGQVIRKERTANKAVERKNNHEINCISKN